MFSETEVPSSVTQQELPPNKNNNLKMPASTIQSWGRSHRKPSAGILLVFPRSSMVRWGGASPYGWSPQQTPTLPQYVAPFVLSLSSTFHLSLISFTAFSLSLSSLFLYIFFTSPASIHFSFSLLNAFTPVYWSIQHKEGICGLPRNLTSASAHISLFLDL